MKEKIISAAKTTAATVKKPLLAVVALAVVTFATALGVPDTWAGQIANAIIAAVSSAL